MPLYTTHQRGIPVWRRFPLFWMWVMGILLGIVFALAMSDSMSEILKEYVGERMEAGVNGNAFLRCLIVNGRFMVLLAAVTYLPLAMVWLQVLMAGYGFFFGFSIQIMARLYGFMGIMGAVLSYIPHNLFLIPILGVTLPICQNSTIRRSRWFLWILVVCMALLSAIVEIKTAPAVLNWCLGGRI